MSISLPMVYDGTAYTRRLHPISCKISRTLQPLSTVTMTLPPMDEISVLDWVRIESPDGVVEYYRVANVTTDATSGEHDVYLEHGACLLDDKIIVEQSGRKSLSVSGTVTSALTSLLAGQSRWKVGTIEDTESVYLEPGNTSIMTAILTMMAAIPDYQLEFVQASETDWHIDIKVRPTNPLCECRLSRNLKSCDITYTADGICTKVYSDALSGGSMSSANISEYGLHEQTLSINENLSDQQKERVARAYLDAHDHPAVSISISGVELSQITGLPIDQFRLGTVCKVVLPSLGMVEDEVIIDKRYGSPYTYPEDVSFTLANATPDLSLTVAAITGGGGGGGGMGSSGLGGQAAELDRYETKFEQTKEYFRLIATENEYDAMGNKTVTAYGQMVLTHDSFQVVVDNIGEGSILGGTAKITPATITLSINQEEGSVAYIQADHIDLHGYTTINGDLDVHGTSCIIGGEDGTLYCHTMECYNLEADGGGYIFATNLYFDSDGYMKLHNGGFEYGERDVTWQSKTVVTGATITMPSISTRYSNYWVYAMNGDTEDLRTTSGYIVASSSSGSSSVSTDTIYYLGRSQA